MLDKINDVKHEEIFICYFHTIYLGQTMQSK